MRRKESFFSEYLPVYRRCEADNSYRDDDVAVNEELPAKECVEANINGIAGYGEYSCGNKLVRFLLVDADTK